MEGVAKVIEELGRMILAKEFELESKECEIGELRQKVALLESYLDVYDEFYSEDR